MTEKNVGRTGDTFGPYRLDAQLGRGGMGEVYRAHDTARDRDVALKLLPPELASDSTFQARFRRECQTLARLGEPHIIPIHDFGEIDGVLYLDMRLVEGRDLRSIVKEGAVEPSRAVALIEQIAAALDAAHEADLVHRDVKPENILVTPADFAYLIDFGIAHTDNDTHLTRTGTAIGSVAYMSPEQFSDDPITRAVDVYALSAVLFELLTGRQPYPGKSVSTVTRGVLFDDIPAASSVNPAIGPALDAVVAWGLHKTAEERCPSGAALAEAARNALDGVMPDGAAAADSATSMLPNSGYAPTSQASFPAPQVPQPAPQSPAADVTMARSVPVATPVFTPSGGVPSYPGAYPPAAYQVAPQQNSGRGGYGVMIALGAVIAILLGIGGFLLAEKFGGSDDDRTTTAADVQPNQPADDTSSGSGHDGVTTTMTTTAAPTYTPGAPPPDNQPCPGFSGVGTGYPQWTGCEFAANVRDSYLAAGPNGQSRTVNGWAPQMQKNFVMTCDPYMGIIACRGGNQAVVYIY